MLKQQGYQATKPHTKTAPASELKIILGSEPLSPLALWESAQGALVPEHRFAIEYHRKLRGKSSIKSLLDEVPGIGPRRKRSLIRTFGSLARTPFRIRVSMSAMGSVMFIGLTSPGSYQLALITPGISPARASFRKQIRHISNLRM